MTKAICILLAEGFEESEAVVPADLLKRLGVNIIFTSITNNKDVRGAHGFKFIADTTINNISTNDFDALMLPGGLPGTTNLRDNNDVISLVNKANENNKIISATMIFCKHRKIPPNNIIYYYFSISNKKSGT